VERVLASPWSSWARMAEDLQAEFSDLSPLLLPLFSGIDSTELLIDVLELPRVANPPQVPRLNASLSAVHTSWLRAFNEEGSLSPHDRDIVIDVMQRHLPVSSQPDTVFNPALRRHIADRSANEWRDLVDLLRDRIDDVPALRSAREAQQHPAKAVIYSGTIALGEPSMSALVALTRSTLVEMNGRRSTTVKKFRHAARRLSWASA